jgi:DNA-binding Xre family transcriptional regulator
MQTDPFSTFGFYESVDRVCKRLGIKYKGIYNGKECFSGGAIIFCEESENPFALFFNTSKPPLIPDFVRWEESKLETLFVKLNTLVGTCREYECRIKTGINNVIVYRELPDSREFDPEEKIRESTIMTMDNLSQLSTEEIEMIPLSIVARIAMS